MEVMGSSIGSIFPSERIEVKARSKREKLQNGGSSKMKDSKILSDGSKGHTQAIIIKENFRGVW